MKSLVVLAILVGTASADTLGFPPCNTFDASWTAAGTRTTSAIYVARDKVAWGELWKRTERTTAAPEVDFATQMVVGVENSKDDHVIYRVELDDAAHPKALVVRTGYPDAPCGASRTPGAVRVHFVSVPRSHLPVHFVFDELVDGRVFSADNEGVNTKDLGTMDVTAAPRSKDAAVEREDAERAVVASLSAADRNKLATGPLDRAMRRVPHAWTKTTISRDATTWKIQYDGRAFTVDVHTGKVTTARAR